MQTKQFIFDIGNVLVNFDFNEFLQRVATDSNQPVKPLTLRDLEMHHAVEKGHISDQEFVDYINQTEGLNWTLDELIGVWRKMFTLNETGYGLLRKAIQSGVPVYTLSNIAEHHIQAIVRNFPGLFDGVTRMFLSYQIGSRKPEAEIYSHLLNALRVDGSYSLFLDDLADNVSAARAAGIAAYQFIPENYESICTMMETSFGK
ncbi:MAG: HAD-IA family hydrolase [Kiritimatiellaceae bacterium]|nr:HAD-IA family hydrolase [Kiritimatiellaceae bacterium]